MNTVVVARTPAELSKELLTDILRSAGVISSRCSVSDVTYRGVGDGMMSDSFRFSLEYEGDAGNAPSSVVGKFAAADPTSRATATSLQLYETEVLFYERLAGTVDVRTPRILFSAVDSATQDFTLIMEDQFPARSVDQMQGCSVADCATAMREMARLHGPRWGDPQLAQTDWLVRRNAIMLQVIEQTLAPAVSDFTERFRGRMEPEYLDVIKRFEAVFPKLWSDQASPRTIAHTDFRPDNLLYDVRGDEGSVVVLDWAGILHMSGLLDVGYFLGSALTAEQRHTHERDLLQQYYDELSKYRIGDYDFDACWLDYRRFPFYGLFTALAAQMMVERSERSDALFLNMGRQFCEMVTDLGSLSLWE